MYVHSHPMSIAQSALTKTQGYHVQVTARSDSDLTPEDIMRKVSDASGAKYSSSESAPAPAAKPPVATKPVFGPTKFGNSTLPVGGRAPFKKDEKVDADGWGADAPPVTRSQLEAVPSAYKPTKVDIEHLRSQPTSTTSGSGHSRTDSEVEREVVKGGYQPIGKIDIAALRKGYKEERPEPVKGSYQPVDVASSFKKKEPEPEPERPRPLSERMSAFSQNAEAERLTSLPKPKVAKKFGTGAPSYGTKPLTPGTFGLASAPVVPSGPQVGSINKTGITKSPAQLWAEKKAKERGESTPPTISPAATGGSQITPSYTGASAASQQREEEETTPSGGISALRNKFAGSAPIGFASTPSPSHHDEPEGRSFEPPSRPPIGHVAIPGLPARQPEPEPEEEEIPHQEEVRIPTPPPQPPRSPTPPTPDVPGSPIRVAMPVARRDDPTELEKPSEPQSFAPVESLKKVIPKEEELPEEAPVAAPSGSHGIRATVLYDYEAQEDNEIDLFENQVVTEIDMVDEDWWAGTNAQGKSGLFPSNYVEVIQESAAEEKTAPPRTPSPELAAPSAPAAPAAPARVEPAKPAAAAGPTAIALYDYEAQEDNEISFPEGATITNLEFPDDDWWQGTYKGKEGLFVSLSRIPIT